MKRVISLTSKGAVINEYACANCFAILDEEDEYCWNCGANLDFDDIAYSFEDLRPRKVKK